MYMISGFRSLTFSPQSKLSEFQRQTCLKEQPSLLEIAAFSLFPGSFLVGPQFSMRRYQSYVHGRLIENVCGFCNQIKILFYVLLCLINISVF